VTWPTLSVADVRAILRAAGFELKRTRGSHEQWEGRVDGVRRLVTLDVAAGPFTRKSRVLASMIRQSGLGRRGFYSLLP